MSRERDRFLPACVSRQDDVVAWWRDGESRKRASHQSSRSPTLPSSSRSGFTLLELLIALTIMSLAMTVVVATFVATLKGWQKGSALLDELHHGDFVMEQLVSALRSSAYFPNAPEKYGFWLEDDAGGRYPTDAISFVTSGTAFLPTDSLLANGLHRLEFTIDDNDDGDPAVSIRAIPHLMNPEDFEGDPWFVSTVVKGFDCRTYNLDDEDWEDEWEDTNAIPSLIEVTLYMDPLEGDTDPVVLSRVVEIPVAPVVANAVQFREDDAEDEAIAEQDREAGEAAELGELGLDPRGGGGGAQLGDPVQAPGSGGGGGGRDR